VVTVKIKKFFNFLIIDSSLVDSFGTKENIGNTKRFFVYYLCKIYVFICMKTLGIFYTIRNYEDINGIYKKYLGDDYQIEKNKKYSLIISNHISWTVILFYF